MSKSMLDESLASEAILDEEIAKFLIGDQMKMFFDLEGGVISPELLASTTKVYGEIDKIDRTNTVSVITMAVVKSDVNGEPAFTVTGGVTGNLAMLMALSVLISSQVKRVVDGGEVPNGVVSSTLQ